MTVEHETPDGTWITDLPESQPFVAEISDDLVRWWMEGLLDDDTRETHKITKMALTHRGDEKYWVFVVTPRMIEG